ncbi:MAG TPA: RodZ domain-containing protein [Candidatus Nanopelagicaceae bacterium]|nr:RodZ domain-containing protein [Candidatus Nanopelagicaceae bacterium]
MTIGSTIRAARENANISLAELSEKTRLRQTLLSGIERDDFSACGGNVYARGHLRNIARLIGLDSAELVAEFDSTYASDAESLEESSKGFSEVTSARQGKAKSWRGAGIFVGVVSVVLLAWLLIPGFHGATASNSASTIPKAVVTETPTQSPPADPSASAVATKPNSVSVIVTSSLGSSWLAVTNASGSQLFTSMLHRGQSKEFTDPQQINLTIGNAGGVEITVNGKNLGVPGGDGQVVHLSFSPGSPTSG